MRPLPEGSTPRVTPPEVCSGASACWGGESGPAPAAGRSLDSTPPPAGGRSPLSALAVTEESCPPSPPPEVALSARAPLIKAPATPLITFTALPRALLDGSSAAVAGSGVGAGEGGGTGCGAGGMSSLFGISVVLAVCVLHQSVVIVSSSFPNFSLRSGGRSAGELR